MKSRSFKNQIFRYFSVFLILAIILISVLFYFTFSDIVTKKTLDNTQMSVYNSGITIEKYTKQIEDLSYTLENMEQINAFYYNPTVTSEVINESNLILQNTVAVKNDIVSIVLVGRDGRVASNETDLPIDVSNDMMHMQWYEDTINNNGNLTLTSARMQEFTMDEDNWVISTSREIIDANGDNYGVMLIDIKYNFVEAILGVNDYGSDGYFYIIDDEGSLVYIEDKTVFKNQEELNKLNDIAFGSEEKVNGLLVTRYSIENTNWNIVALTSLDGIVMLKEDIMNMMLIILTIMLFASLIFTFYFSKKVTKPLSKLEQSMIDIEGKNFNVNVYKSNIIEINELSVHYEQMILRIKELLIEVKTKEKTLREAELFALQSQIKPHFLYNSLETIIWMAEFQDASKVIALTSALSKFFRLSLKSNNIKTTLIEEIEHVKQYLYIQNFRYDDLITFNINIEPRLEKLIVPKLILQPLVENAIDHGLRTLKSSENPKLDIEATIRDENLEIIIKDNGLGFECPENLFLPNSTFIKDKNTATSFEKANSSGIGMNNVALRIQLLCGDNYGVLVNSSKGGTVIKIILPVISDI